jgi:putative FmdB family regulatory protein
MPVYEFYCSECHCIYNFMSRRVDTKTRPPCPKCKKPRLERRVSLFAFSKGLTEADDADPIPDLDTADLEKAMMELARESETLDEDNPRDMGRLIRKLYESTGLELAPGITEAIRRMEAGEDMDKIEADLDEVLQEEDPLALVNAKKKLKRLRNRVLPPNVDDELYEM